MWILLLTLVLESTLYSIILNKELSEHVLLKVSFLGGLIEISGSANYLNHQREYENSYRFTRNYHGEGRDISIDTELSKVNHNNCNSPGATHVVTAVKYGFNAFMTFEVEKLDNEKGKEEIILFLMD